jgi:hypothetical protein
LMRRKTAATPFVQRMAAAMVRVRALSSRVAAASVVQAGWAPQAECPAAETAAAFERRLSES